ncbi:MAG: hypothetical protein EOM66_04250 [Clostridia bacterium]|nr:hypothetical protein [Candidatus Pelethousia sp.]NCB30600.1 hypothetical protein [Clostridia bacterium]
MTLNDIIVSALAQLDRGHDAQTLDIWRDKFTRFANEAVADLAKAYQPRSMETLESGDGVLDTGKFSLPCVKVLSIRRCDKVEPFAPGSVSGTIVLSGGPGKVEVCYRYTPQEMRASTDEPGLPAWCHGLIVCYVVARERASGDVSLQRGSNIYFQMYEAGKADLRPHMGEAASYRLVNRW